MATRKGPEDRFRESENPYDRQRFGIHFVCGALLGALIGFCFWFRLWPDFPASACILVPSISVAILGGLCGDRFWEGFLRFIGRWGSWM
jgi:hypothetical protein